MRRWPVVLALAVMTIPPPASAAGPVAGCGGRWDRNDATPASCTFLYPGGEVFVVAEAHPIVREITPSRPLGPDMQVVADVRFDPADENSVLIRCVAAPGSFGGIASPAACFDGAPEVGVPPGTRLYCTVRGSTHGLFACVSNSL